MVTRREQARRESETHSRDQQKRGSRWERESPYNFPRINSVRFCRGERQPHPAVAEPKSSAVLAQLPFLAFLDSSRSKEVPLPIDSGNSVFQVDSLFRPVHRNRYACAGFAARVGLACCVAGAGPAFAQIIPPANPVVASVSEPAEPAPLPDAPDFSASTAAVEGSSNVASHLARTRHAGRLDKFIEPSEIAQPLDAEEKVLLGFRATVTPFTVVGWFGSATWEQITNDSPNYGENFRGFAQRLGAASARSASNGIFTTSIFAPVLHQDPRYYEMGGGHSVGSRSLYAVSRVFITQTDDGRSTFNLSLLAGDAAGSALTQAYYPQVNRGFGQTAKTYGASLGGSAVSFLLSEFLGPTARRLELKHLD
jgi:hypothetical protein